MGVVFLNLVGNFDLKFAGEFQVEYIVPHP